MNRTLDYSALTRPVSREETKAFKAAVRNKPQYANNNWLAGALVALVGIVTVGGVSVMLTSMSRNGDNPFLTVVPIFFFLFLAVMVAITFQAFKGNRWERWLRLEEFAAANGLTFSPVSPNPTYPGAIFGLGNTRKSHDHLRSADDRFFDMGSYTYVTGSGKSKRTHDWGFLALSLDRALPHMMLDSRSNNSLFGTNLPATFRKDQVLSLEGDFNEHFTLYCPKEYERDALYVFTPDLMALLIDNAAPFDVEIVDKWMFVYSSSRFNPLDPATYQRLFRIIDTVGAKALTQTDRYRDERVGNFAANIVAPPGRRLTRGVSVVSIIIFAVIMIMWGLPFLTSLFEVIR